MARRPSTSWELFRESLSVLSTDKHLILFPIASAVASMLILASFAVPTALLVPWQDFDAQQLKQSPWWYLGLFAFYLVNFFVVTFFNSALVACAAARFEGGDSSAGAGLRAAIQRLPQILAWSILSATVGMVLRAIADRSGPLGAFVIRLIGMGWAIATYFVVPVLVLEGLGPIDSVKRSVEILRRNWGEALVLKLGLGFAGFLLFIAAMIPAGLGIYATAATNSPLGMLVGIPITVALLVVIALVTSTLKVIIQTALYRMVATGQAPAGFDEAALRGAIGRK